MILILSTYIFDFDIVNALNIKTDKDYNNIYINYVFSIYIYLTFILSSFLFIPLNFILKIFLALQTQPTFYPFPLLFL